MTWSIIEIIIGAILLGFGADRFIVASASLADHFKLPRLITGIILVGFGTSFPELIVSATAAFHGKPEIAIGNVIGSNIANIGLVLGLAALLVPIKVHSRLIKREFPVLLLVSVIVGILFWQFHLSRMDGIILLFFLAAQLYWTAKAKPGADDSIIDELNQEMKPQMAKLKATIWWFVGLIILFVSSEMLVDGAVDIAKLLGISDLIIGLTIVTIGTSLPELAATISSVIKKEHDIAIGHIVGSNIFNSLAVLAMPALISPTTFPKAVLTRDYPVMMAFTLGLWLATFCFKKKAVVGRGLGLVLVLAYVGYLLVLII